VIVTESKASGIVADGSPSCFEILRSESLEAETPLPSVRHRSLRRNVICQLRVLVVFAVGAARGGNDRSRQVPLLGIHHAAVFAPDVVPDPGHGKGQSVLLATLGSQVEPVARPRVCPTRAYVK